jgi:hypothetical protein
VTKQKQNPVYRRIDHTGEKYGMLTVIELSGKNSNRDWCWRCRCDCGNERIVRASGLRKARSCGCTKFYRKLPAGIAKQNKILTAYQSGARKRGHVWDLSVFEFSDFVSQDCHYCGCPPDCGNDEFRYNGLDRLDNNKGYYAGNVVPCCWTCNKAKGNLPYDEFRKWIFRVSEHQRRFGGNF